MDENHRVRLTDFGMSLLADAAANHYGSLHGGGAPRWQAPELIEPTAYKLDHSRPTRASDMYSFACTCIEVRSA